MESEGSIPCSQEPATGPYPKPVVSLHLHLGQVSATYGMRAKCGTWNDFQWHAERIEIQYRIS
jgi:hypothetical protein